MMKKKEEAAAAVMDNSNNYGSTSSNGPLDLSGGGGAAGFYGRNQCSTLEGIVNGVDVVGGELGFLEMLGVQEFQIPMLDEMFHERRQVLLPSTRTVTDHHHQLAAGDGNTNEPETPNSSSISSASNNGVVVAESEQEKVEEIEDEEQNQQGSNKSTKQLKAKKGNLKKQRQPRFAFMTKSEVDHLEDGYRWRKYGQKAVKNSPFPRSYYRCTSTSCGVKKRVERSCTDPSIVVTTYEGQHTHPSPLTPHSLTSAMFVDSTALFTATMPTLMQMNHIHSRYQQNLLPSYLASTLDHNIFPTNSLTTISPTIPNNFASFTPSRTSANMSQTYDEGFIRDQGLLQDLIQSLVPKERSSNSS